MVFSAGGGILVGKLSHAAESQEGAESQGGGRMGVHEGVANQDAVFIVLENNLLL